MKGRTLQLIPSGECGRMIFPPHDIGRKRDIRTVFFDQCLLFRRLRNVRHHAEVIRCHLPSRCYGSGDLRWSDSLKGIEKTLRILPRFEIL